MCVCQGRRSVGLINKYKTHTSPTPDVLYHFIIRIVSFSRLGGEYSK